MMILRPSFSTQEAAEKFNELVCSWFQGSTKFINDDVIVSPVLSSSTYSEVEFFFLICLDDGISESYTYADQSNFDYYIKWRDKMKKKNEMSNE